MVCPEIFRADEQGFAVVEHADVPPTHEDTLHRAESQCPERAIQLDD